MTKLFDVKFNTAKNVLVTVQSDDVRVDIYTPDEAEDTERDVTLWYDVCERVHNPHSATAWHQMSPTEYTDAKTGLDTSAGIAEVTAVAVQLWFKYNALYQTKAGKEAYVTACEEVKKLKNSKPRKSRSKNTEEDAE